MKDVRDLKDLTIHDVNKRRIKFHVHAQDEVVQIATEMGYYAPRTQLRGKQMVSLVNSHSNATSRR